MNYLSSFLTEARMERFNEIIRERTRHVCVVLEDIYQPHNASAVLRSCDCFGIQDVHIIENKNKYEVNPDVALGSSKWLTLIKYNQAANNTKDCIAKLKESGYNIAATSPHKNDYLIEELPLNNKIALFFGTEKDGLSEDVLDNADLFVKIPIFGFTESFNISVSVALCLYSITSRLRKSNIKWHLNEEEITNIKIQWIKNTLKNPELLMREFEKK
ncbi:MAG: RNA methyltransferase [Bacteroidales bacterium]|jgi:tRNA (guanosine-2'-O-)-methyltransferase|nr:RNA methyltransferase [Bacteroidales bacterium]